MISCDKASIICNKAQYREAGFLDILKLKLHILLCKTCSQHSRKNSRLTGLCNQAKLRSLSEREKGEMKQKLQPKD
ncbi:MAG: hypothetical protein V7724_00195 [Sediminicola sp.]